MKTVIFAGGLGTRISEESHLKPKPMIEIGGKPILWHIMKIYQSHGFNEFIICLGYKGYIIKEYFINYFYHNADITVDLQENRVTVHKNNSENFKVSLVDTGQHTMTAGRLQRIKKYIGEDETFLLTYGDGVADINLQDLVKFHNKHGKICTVTAVQPAGKFGILDADDHGFVSRFIEKPKNSGSWINGGFLVINKDIFELLDDADYTDIMWEEKPMKTLADKRELVAYKHQGFWKSMDILRDRIELEKLWKEGGAKWKIW